MTIRFQATLDEIITATLVGIASHPLIRNPNIYYPNVDPTVDPQPVYIREFRDFGGLNLDGPDDGLSCSVYPFYSNRNQRNQSPRRLSSHPTTARFEPQVLGARDYSGSYDRVTYLLVVELAYKDAGLGLPVEVEYKLADSPYLRIANHAYAYTLGDPQNIDPSRVDPMTTTWTVQSLTIRTNPAERVLRQYIDLMRHVLADLPTLQPFNIRHTQVMGYDFNTTNWLQHSTDVYFHAAYLLWEVQTYVANSTA